MIGKKDSEEVPRFQGTQGACASHSGRTRAGRGPATTNTAHALGQRDCHAALATTK